jgi:hypothetical protein
MKCKRVELFYIQIKFLMFCKEFNFSYCIFFEKKCKVMDFVKILIFFKKQ